MFGAARGVGSSYLVNLRRQSRNSRASRESWPPGSGIPVHQGGGHLHLLQPPGGYEGVLPEEEGSSEGTGGDNVRS